MVFANNFAATVTACMEYFIRVYTRKNDVSVTSVPFLNGNWMNLLELTVIAKLFLKKL